MRRRLLPPLPPRAFKGCPFGARLVLAFILLRDHLIDICTGAGDWFYLNREVRPAHTKGGSASGGSVYWHGLAVREV